MQHQSKIQKHMIKNSYRRHKQRLTNIKQNNTSLHFYSSSKTKQSDRKKLMMLQEKRDQIDHQNQLLQQRIHRIKIRGIKNQVSSRRESKQKSKNISRYNQQNQQEYHPIQVNSDYGDDMIKCIIPAPFQGKKNNNYNLQKTVKGLNYSKSGLKQQKELQNDDHSSVNQLKNRGTLQIRKSVDNYYRQNKIQQLPENILDKIVLYKKTTMLAPMISCLLEISLIDNKLLFLAYVMGIQNYTSKLLLQQNKTIQLLSQYNNDYQSLGSKVSIDCFRQIKINGLFNEGNKSQHIIQINKKQSRKKQIYQNQQDFLKRNYYVKQKIQNIKTVQQNRPNIYSYSNNNSNNNSNNINQNKGPIRNQRGKINMLKRFKIQPIQSHTTQKNSSNQSYNNKNGQKSQKNQKLSKKKQSINSYRDNYKKDQQINDDQQYSYQDQNYQEINKKQIKNQSNYDEDFDISQSNPNNSKIKSQTDKKSSMNNRSNIQDKNKIIDNNKVQKNKTISNKSNKQSIKKKSQYSDINLQQQKYQQQYNQQQYQQSNEVQQQNYKQSEVKHSQKYSQKKSQKQSFKKQLHVQNDSKLSYQQDFNQQEENYQEDIPQQDNNEDNYQQNYQEDQQIENEQKKQEVQKKQIPKEKVKKQNQSKDNYEEDFDS